MQKLLQKTYTNPPLAMKVYIKKPITTEYKLFNLQYRKVLM